MLLLALTFAVGTSGGWSATAGAPVPVPLASPGFTVTLADHEPLVRNPCALAFDARGRLFVGQGPQYRNPKPDTPGDTVELLLDTDGDGVFDRAKTFARGLNCVQGLAWRGNELWIANSPDLTVVRDLDGDDEADEYVLLYTDLGNIEHAVHGLNFAPDGKLYLSKGNSKGLNQPGRVAPKAFRELHAQSDPPGAPDLPPPRTFTKETYRRTYQDPADDWGRMGGILRCNPDGTRLEIVSRGFRNPWDIAFDRGFDWLGTDNDQSEGDRIFMPFFGANFGWAHGWSAHWTGDGHLPTVPISGPMFSGSGTGITYSDTAAFPAAFRGVWFINDFLHRTTYVYRPRWDGALLQPAGGKWEPFLRAGEALFNPVDIESGPDGALYLTGWGEQLGAEFRDGRQVNAGRVFRVAASGARPPLAEPHRAQPLARWTFAQLVADFGSPLAARRSDAAEELVRRGAAVRPELARLILGGLPEASETWALWTLGRLERENPDVEAWLAAHYDRFSPNARRQALRVAGHRIREWRPGASLPAFVTAALADPEPRIRFAALQAIAVSRRPELVDPVSALAARETDRVTAYAAWYALREIASVDALRDRLRDPRGGVRRAALLALLDLGALDEPAVRTLVGDADAATAGVAALWLAKRDGNPLLVIEPPPGDFVDRVRVKITPGMKPATVRYTTDGAEPVFARGGERPNLTFTETTTLKAALFVNGQKVGNTATAVYRKRVPEPPPSAVALTPPAAALTLAQVVAALPTADVSRGRAVFHAAGCVACHRVDAEGGAFGPELTSLGARGNVERVIRAMLDPGAEITEGFALRTFTLKDGKSLAGRLLEESQSNLTLIQPDNQTVTLTRADILNQDTLPASAMPPFDRAMSAPDFAALVAWLTRPSP